METYKQSPHYRAGVGCQKCHTKPGVFNYFIRNLQGVTNLILYVSNTYERPITTFVGSDNCVQCHPKSEIEKDQVFGNIRVNHTGLREAGYQCVTCHANISHPGTQLDSRAHLAEQDGRSARAATTARQLPDTCSTCHVGGAPAEEINVPIKGHVTAGQCQGCHEQQGVLRQVPPRSGDAAPGALEPRARRASSSIAARASASRATSRRTPSSASTATAC